MKFSDGLKNALDPLSPGEDELMEIARRARVPSRRPAVLRAAVLAGLTLLVGAAAVIFLNAPGIRAGEDKASQLVGKASEKNDAEYSLKDGLEDSKSNIADSACELPGAVVNRGAGPKNAPAIAAEDRDPAEKSDNAVRYGDGENDLYAGEPAVSAQIGDHRYDFWASASVKKELILLKITAKNGDSRYLELPLELFGEGSFEVVLSGVRADGDRLELTGYDLDKSEQNITRSFVALLDITDPASPVLLSVSGDPS